MQKKTHSSINTIVSILLFFPLFCQAEDIEILSGSVTASLGTSFKSYQYDLTSSAGKVNYFNETLPSIKYAVGYQTSGNMYFLFAGDVVINDNQQTIVNPSLSSNTFAKTERNDHKLEASFPLTQLSAKSSVRGVLGYRVGNTYVDYTAEKSNESDHIKTYGPYAGLNFSYNITPTNRLGASFLYNHLSTELDMEVAECDCKFNFDGHGFFTNLSWTHDLNENTFLVTSAEFHKYDHDKMTNSSTPVESFSLEESAYSARVELMYRF